MCRAEGVDHNGVRCLHDRLAHPAELVTAGGGVRGIPLLGGGAFTIQQRQCAARAVQRGAGRNAHAGGGHHDQVMRGDIHAAAADVVVKVRDHIGVVADHDIVADKQVLKQLVAVGPVDPVPQTRVRQIARNVFAAGNTVMKSSRVGVGQLRVKNIVKDLYKLSIN